MKKTLRARMARYMSRPGRSPPPPPPPARRTTVPHYLLIRTKSPAGVEATQAEAAGVESASIETTIVECSVAPAQSPTSSQTTTGETSDKSTLPPGQAAAPQPAHPTIQTPSPPTQRIQDPSIPSTSDTASFLGLPTELCCMIYENLYTPSVDVYIQPRSRKANKPRSAIHPIFQVNQQLRAEAADHLTKTRAVDLHFRAEVRDFNFRHLEGALRLLGSGLFREGSNKFLHVGMVSSGEWDGGYADPERLVWLGRLLGFVVEAGVVWKYRVSDGLAEGLRWFDLGGAERERGL